MTTLDPKRLKQDAQDAIIAALVNAAFNKDEAGEPEVAHCIRLEATKMARRWGLSEVSGLPLTWPRGKKVPDYD
jgi:hypothetical protein